MRFLSFAGLRNPGSAVRRLNLLLLTAALLWCAYWFFQAWHYWEDDAWIHLEFARSLARGQGFAFSGRVVSGDTAPLWVLLLVGVHAFLVNWMAAGKTLTVVGALFGFSGVYAFAVRLARGIPEALETALFPMAMVLLVAASPFTCYWLFSGMEPIAGAGLACWAVLLATCDRPTRSGFLLGCLLAGFAPLIRPELTFLTVLLVLPLIGQWRNLQGARKLGALASGALLLCGPVFCWAAYSLHAFGHVMPNTNAAKRAGPGQPVIAHLVSTYALGFPLLLAAAAAGVIYVILYRTAARRSLAAAVRQVWQPGSTASGLPAAAWLMLLWGAVVSVFYVVNHTYVQTRYTLLIAPGLLAVVMGAALMWSRSAGRVVYLLALVEALAVSLLIARSLMRNKVYDDAATARLAAYMREHLPPEAPVAVYSIGEVGFLSSHPIVDTGGITRPDVLPYLSGSGPLSALPWAQAQGAQYWIGIQPQAKATLVSHEQLRFAAWTIHRARYNETEWIELWRLELVR